MADSLNDVLEYQLLLLTSQVRALTRMKVKDPMKTRFEHTWHHQPLIKHWATTIGMWGGTTSHTDIMKRANVDYPTLKYFRSRFNLSTKGGHQQWELAVSSFIRWTYETTEKYELEPTVTRVAARFGILPIELRIYVDRMTRIASDLNLTGGDLLDKKNYDAVEVVWGDHKDDIDAMVVSSYSQVVQDE